MRWPQHSLIACLLSVLVTLSSVAVASPDIWVEPLHTEFSAPAARVSAGEVLIEKRQVTASRIVLPPLSDQFESKLQRSDLDQDPVAVPLQVGTGRPLAETQTPAAFSEWLKWELQTDGSKVAAIEFVSPDALGGRLLLGLHNLDPRVGFVFSGDDQAETVAMSGFEVLDSVFSTNEPAQSEQQAANKRFASPYVSGDTFRLQVTLPADVPVDQLGLSVPGLSHLFISPVASDPWLKNVGASGSCNVDSTCRPEWDTASRGVARMLFSDPFTGGSFLCTGSLLNDTSNSTTPYFLTANHCLSTQSVASTLQTFWFYRSTFCNSGVLNPGYQTRSGGATLLFTQSATDTTLLRLNNTPPSGVSFLGWTTAVPGQGTSLASLHHPRGDTTKVSLANLSYYANCSTTQCFSGPLSNTSYFGVNWSSGVVEPGSSGSALFWPDGGRQYVIGQLLGGSSSCSEPEGTDFYGRFDLAFAAGMGQFLNSTPPVTPPEDEPDDPVVLQPEPEQPRAAVYRFYNNNSRAHFFTASAAERDQVIERYASFIYEGTAFYTYSSVGDGLSPVYRFFNQATGSHFYTISQAERDNVIERFPNYLYEGVAWYARTSSGSASQPLFRFYNTATRAHFYTTSAAERDNVIDRYPSYIYEGVGYYTWLSP